MYFWLAHATHNDVCAACAAHVGRMHAIFVRDACRISGILQTFRAIFAQNLRDVDAGRALFSDLNAMLTRSSLSDAVQYAQRMLAECLHFFVRGAGACRISDRNFANFSRIYCAEFA